MASTVQPGAPSMCDISRTFDALTRLIPDIFAVLLNADAI